MKTLIAALLACTQTQLAAQCHYATFEVDEFTKTRHIDTDVEFKGYLGKKATFIFSQADSLYFISTVFELVSGSYVVGMKDELMLKLGNDSILTVVSGSIQSAEHTRYQASIFCAYIADHKMIELLANEPILKCRWYYSRGYNEFDIPEEARIAIQEAARCLLEAKAP